MHVAAQFKPTAKNRRNGVKERILYATDEQFAKVQIYLDKLKKEQEDKA